jgi:ethanolaminephosphotransferase
MAPLTQDKLENMNQFKYKYTNYSIVYTYLISPCLNKLVEYVPRNLAPNVITLCSLLCNIIAVIVSTSDGGFDFSHTLKTSTCYVIGFLQILYQLLDALDGKQARRTGNSTPFGMLMDHGCDIFTTILTSYNMSKILIVGNEGFFSYSVFFGLLTGFFMMTFEDYKIGEMVFPMINGADEGNFVVFIIGVLCGIFGQGWILYVPISRFESLTIGKIFALVIVIGSFGTIFNLYYNTYKKKNCNENFRNFMDNLAFYNVLLIPIIYSYTREEFWLNFKWIVILNTSLLFARVTLDVQIKIATMDTFRCNFMFIFSNLILIISLFIKNSTFNFYFLACTAIFKFAELAVFIYFRANEITEFLEIRIFCVKSADSSDMVKV